MQRRAKCVYSAQSFGTNHRLLTFISRDRGWPIPPAAPIMATFLAGDWPLAAAKPLEACSAHCIIAREEGLMV